jgi:hypothetical protein
MTEMKRQSVAIFSSCTQGKVLHPSDRDNVGALEMCGTDEVSYNGSKGGMPQVEAVSARSSQRHLPIRDRGSGASLQFNSGERTVSCACYFSAITH